MRKKDIETELSETKKLLKNVEIALQASDNELKLNKIFDVFRFISSLAIYGGLYGLYTSISRLEASILASLNDGDNGDTLISAVAEFTKALDAIDISLVFYQNKQELKLFLLIIGFFNTLFIFIPAIFNLSGQKNYILESNRAVLQSIQKKHIE